MTFQQIVFIVTVALIFIMSFASLLLFIKDKKLAEQGKMRIKEKTLLASAACFGALGARIGRIVAHHKTQKTYFSIVIWVSLILQVLLVVYVGYLAFVF